jgi:ankyrin repeat protein
MTAADRGNPEHVRLLVSLGADTRVKDSEGYTATDLANQSGHTAVAEFLSKFGK